MTDTTAPAPSPWFEILKAAMPSLGQALVMVVGLLVAIGTTWWVTKPPLTFPVALPDLPRPAPVVSLSDVDHSLQVHCGEVKTLLLERLPAPAKRAPGR